MALLSLWIIAQPIVVEPGGGVLSEAAIERSAA